MLQANPQMLKFAFDVMMNNQKLLDKIDRTINELTNSLLEHQLDDGGFKGYHLFDKASGIWSTCEILHVLIKVKPEMASEIWAEKAAKYVADMQNPAGGWGFRGKGKPVVDVTAWACLALSHFDYPTEVKSGVDFLLTARKNEGGIDKGGWGLTTFEPDRIYSTWIASNCLNRILNTKVDWLSKEKRNEILEALDESHKWIAGSKNADGGWGSLVFQAAYGFDAKPDKLFENFVVETFLPYSETNKKSFTSDVFICRVLTKSFRGKTLRQITPPMIEELKQERLSTPTKHGQRRSPATVNRLLSVLSKIFSLASDAEIVDSNPCRKVRKFRLNNQRIRVLSSEEEVQLLAALGENELVKQIVIFALNTAFRRGEIFNLKWLDADFNRGMIQIRESKSNRMRVVPMNSTVRSLLNGLDHTSEFVFPSPKTGGRLNQIKRSFRRAVDKAGIEDFRFHDLRHTAATRMADAGADAFTLMKILGHSDIRMTARYTHATDASLKRAVANLDIFSQFGNELVTEQKRQAQGLP